MNEVEQLTFFLDTPLIDDVLDFFLHVNEFLNIPLTAKNGLLEPFTAFRLQFSLEMNSMTLAMMANGVFSSWERWLTIRSLTVLMNCCS